MPGGGSRYDQKAKEEEAGMIRRPRRRKQVRTGGQGGGSF